MGLKDNWKETGKGLGNAFKKLGKNIVKTAKVGIDKVDDLMDDGEINNPPESNVTNDGSWKETGKELGSAFKDLGKSILESVEAGAEKAEEYLEEKKEEKEQENK